MFRVLIEVVVTISYGCTLNVKVKQIFFNVI